MTSDEVYQTIEMEFLQRNQYLNHIQVNKLLSGFALANKGSVVYFQYSLHDVSSRTKVDGIDY